jgi:hypothetical protein
MERLIEFIALSINISLLWSEKNGTVALEVESIFPQRTDAQRKDPVSFKEPPPR